MSDVTIQGPKSVFDLLNQERAARAWAVEQTLGRCPCGSFQLPEHMDSVVRAADVLTRYVMEGRVGPNGVPMVEEEIDA